MTDIERLERIETMSRIRVLPDQVANQIAAGEVVERPVSVVKELVENSLDSGATKLEVEFRKGGKSYIRVEDNGSGMSPDEAILCLERHATSKLREAVDLQDILSFGFRGEAIPSIASISRFLLRTRSADHTEGTEILINGGKFLTKKECGMPQGTRIEITQLFSSVPARRKFLKTDNTEAAHISHLIRLYAVAHPEVSFTLIENGKTLFCSPVCERLEDRIAEIYGTRIAGDLMPIEKEQDGLKVFGLIGKVGVGRSTRQEMMTLVNNRPVDSRLLNFSLIEAYHSYIPRGKFPLAFLFVQISPSAIDVNIHPAKREIKFRDEGVVRNFIIRAVLDEIEKGSVKHELKEDFSSEPFKKELNVELVASDVAVEKVAGEQPLVKSVAQSEVIDEIARSEFQNVEAVKAESSLELKKNEIDWVYLGKVRKSLVVLKGKGGVVLLHCRAALERIQFEKIRKYFLEDIKASQTLLIPIPLELDPITSDTLMLYLPFFSKQGFQIEEFGRNFFRIEALPNWLDESQGEVFIRDIIDLAREKGSARKLLAEDDIARKAAKDIMQYHDDFSEEKVLALLTVLFECENPTSCPFGKPVYREYSWTEFEKKFERPV